MENLISEGKTDPGVPAQESEDIDNLNDETFGDGAIEGDWEASHFIMTGGAHGGDSPYLPTGLQDELGSDIAKLKIKELWPSTPQSAARDSIWSSPELPVESKFKEDSSSIPPGSKVMSLEELERELTHSPPSTSSDSTSPHPPHPQGPSHILPHPQSVSPSQFTGPPPPGIIQRPPPGLPHPLMMWPPHMQGPGRGPPPQSAFRPLIPPPNIPMLRCGILTPGHLIQIHQQQQQAHSRPPYPIPPPGGAQPIPVPPGPRGAPPMPHGAGGTPPMPVPVPPGPGGVPVLPPPGAPLPMARHLLPPQLFPAHPLLNLPNVTPVKSKRSEYLDEMKADGSGFMTQKEKDWVIKIQLVQLRSPDPENEDYYYQNYLKRKAQAKHAQSTAADTPTDDDQDATPTSTTRPLPEIAPSRTYKPKEFQQTLGKLHVSSIAAPRKMIDVPLSVEGGGKEGGGAGLETYVKKKQALVVIEKLYTLVLALEELERRGVAGVGEAEREEMVVKREELTTKAFVLLRLKPVALASTKNDDAMLLVITNFRKGKRVIKRILPFLSGEQARSVVFSLSRNLPSIIKKDSNDKVLPELALSITSILPSMNLDLVGRCISNILEGAGSSSSHQLSRVCANEFGATLLLKLIRCGVEAASCLGEGDGSREEWLAVLKCVRDSILVYKDKLTSKNYSKPTSELLLCVANLSA